jgi:hypothetical protein
MNAMSKARRAPIRRPPMPIPAAPPPETRLLFLLVGDGVTLGVDPVCGVFFVEVTAVETDVVEDELVLVVEEGFCGEVAVTRPGDATFNADILKTQKKCSNIPTSAWESDYMKVIVLVEACLADFIQKAGLHLGKRIASRVTQMALV